MLYGTHGIFILRLLRENQKQSKSKLLSLTKRLARQKEPRKIIKEALENKDVPDELIKMDRKYNLD